MANRSLPQLDRLAAAAGSTAADDINWDPPIDRTRWYFCETLTPLYYTNVYRELSPEHQRRYNQLTGMLTSELIALLETDFLHAALNAVSHGGVADARLRDAVSRFAADEQRHVEIWRQLSRLSEPGWYATGSRRVVRVPPYASVLLRFLSRHPVAFPVVFWILLAQEERSVEISRRCMRMPVKRIEPRYAAAFAAHIQDEVRHVQIDRHLIESFYGNRSLAVRRMTARLFRTITRSLLLRPAHSTNRVIDLLVAEHPELLPMKPRVLRELRCLDTNDDYHEMMYSRRSTPVTFSLFDRFEEFHQMQYVLRSYQPHAAQTFSGAGALG